MINGRVESRLALVLQLVRFLPNCRLSYLGLITGLDVERITTIVLEEDEDDFTSCFSLVNQGASLAVIWGHTSSEVAQVAEDDFAVAKDELRTNQTKRWQAVGMLKHIFSSAKLPWKLKEYAMDFLLYITGGNNSQKCNDEDMDCSFYTSPILSALEAIEMVIIYAPEAVLRKSAFDALKRVLTDIPISTRFEMLKALTKNSKSTSMIAILLDIVRDEMHKEKTKRTSVRNEDVPQDGIKSYQNTSFWSENVLELVEMVLRPPQGGPPLIPEHSDAVLSALNLYRFVLITESAGKTNYTGILSKNNLQKAYNDWLLPLRTLVMGIMAENREDYDPFAVEMVCALNPVEFVLYRCIELVEEQLKHPAHPNP